MYRVYPNDSSDTWKYGISSSFVIIDGVAKSKRPTASITSCEAYYGAGVTCVWSVVAFAPTYNAARQIERGLIVDYQMLNGGLCPPGQPSCK
ncbi:hypothetical protein [Schumannella luteola]